MKATVERYESLPFVWGETDCCCFVNDCLKELHGTDFAVEFDWCDEASAKALLKQRSLESMVESVLGASRVGYEDGDVALVHLFGNDLLGIVEGDRVLLRSEVGLLRIPVGKARAIWCPIWGS